MLPELAGKAKRVTGVFLFMLGAGGILDCQALWLGAAVMFVGAAVFTWGLIDAQPGMLQTAQQPVADSQPRATASTPSESHP
jgi:hypothetical protein